MPTNPDTLFQEASCFRCNSNASEADLLELALLDRISTAASSDSTPGLPLTSVQFNDAGSFGGDADFTWNKTTNLLSITGGIALTGEANETQLAVTGYSLTGANAQSMVSLAGTWNTSGTPTAIDLNITDTASNASSLLMNLRVGGATSVSVSKDRILSVGNSAVGGFGELKVHQGGGSTFGIRVLSPRAGLTRNSTLFFAYYDITNGNTVLDTIFAGAKIQLMTASTSRWEVANAGHFITGLDNTYDIGAVGATRPRIGYFGTRVDAPTLRTDTAFTVGTLPAAGVAGRRAYVTDALAPAYQAVVAGGGAVVTSVMDNGAAWIVS